MAGGLRAKNVGRWNKLMIRPRTLRLTDPAYNDDRPDGPDQLVLDRPDRRGETGQLIFQDQGKTSDRLELIYLGGGEFKCAYQDQAGQKVYVVVSDLKPDYNLACFEFIGRYTSSVHLPKVSLVGFTALETIYQMKRYWPVESQQEQAERSILKGCWGQVRKKIETKSGFEGRWDFIYQGASIRQQTMECLQGDPGLKSSLLRAANLIDEACGQIGDTQTLSFDFGDENFAQDDKARLIFLDPLIDLEVLNFPEDYADIEGYSYGDSLYYLACFDGGRRL